MLARRSRKLGLTYRLHPHALRHAFASELVDEGAPLNLVQAAPGHSSLTTTAVYVQRLKPREVLKLLRNRRFAPTAQD